MHVDLISSMQKWLDHILRNLNVHAFFGKNDGWKLIFDLVSWCSFKVVQNVYFINSFQTS